MANIVHFVALLTVRLVDTQTEYVPVKQGGQGGIAQQVHLYFYINIIDANFGL